jgi:hypothetical protein
MTKSELRQMIREMLHEELKLVEARESANIKDVLTGALVKGGNILVKATPGTGIISSCRAWAKENNIKLYAVNVRHDVDKLDSSFAGTDANAVVLFDGLDRLKQEAFDKVLDSVQLAAKSAAFIIVIAEDTTMLTNELGNRFFKYKV